MYQVLPVCAERICISTFKSLSNGSDRILKMYVNGSDFPIFGKCRLKNIGHFGKKNYFFLYSLVNGKYPT